MTNAKASSLTVYVVDDDAAMRDSLALMLGLQGYRIASFESAEALLAAYRDDWSGCIVADLKLPGKSGIALQSELLSRGSHLPFILITAHGDIASARAAFRLEAVDFLEKPFDDADLRSAIDKSFEVETQRIQKADTFRAEAERLSRLTAREREVLDLVGRGLHAKEIAAALGISPRTVDVHKARLMEKLEARNAAELVRYALAGEKAG
jgi:RNA polymerase sigma factor (sigma-70 family)